MLHTIRLGVFTSSTQNLTAIEKWCADLDFDVVVTSIQNQYSLESLSSDFDILFVESGSDNRALSVFTKICDSHANINVVALIQRPSYQASKRLLEVGAHDVVVLEDEVRFKITVRKAFDALLEIQELPKQPQDLSLTALEGLQDAFYLLEVKYGEERIDDFVIKAINQAACQQLGKSRDELIGFGICELFPINRTNGFFNQYVKVFETGEALVQQYEVPNEYEAPGWYRHSVVKIEGGIVIYNQEISEILNVRKELLHEKEKLKAAIVGTRAGIYDWHIPDGMVYINKMYATELGYEFQELNPLTYDAFSEMLHPEDRDVFAKAIRDYFNGEEEFYECEFRLRRKSGSYTWLFARGEVVEYDEENQPKRMIGIQINNTEKKKAELALDNAKKNYEAVINSSDELIWSIDKKMRISSMNQVFRNVASEAFGFKMELGQNIVQRPFPEETSKEWKRKYQKALNGNRLSFRLHMNENGRDYEFTLNPIINSKKKIIGVACYGKDITDSISYLKLLKSQNQHLRNIAFLQSHVVRAPMSNILSLVEMIEMDKRNTNEYLGMLESSAKELDDVLKTSVRELNEIESQVKKSKFDKDLSKYLAQQ